MSKPQRVDVEPVSSAEVGVSPPSTQQNPEPTVTELAMIAASLVRQGNQREWSALVSEAMQLWSACDEAIRMRRELRRRKRDELCAGLPKPCGDRTPLADFLERNLPKKRSDEREMLYRHFLMDLHDVDLGEASDLIARAKGEPMRDYVFTELAYLLRVWLKAKLRADRTLAGLKSKRPSSSEIATAEIEAPEKRKRALADAKAAWLDAYRMDIRKLGVF
jgi:hypothetical protein